MADDSSKQTPAGGEPGGETKTVDPLPIVDFYLLTRTITVRKDGESVPLDEHVTDVIRQACAASRYHNKESSVTITLKFKPGSGYTMDVFPDVTSKVPTDKPSPIPMFSDNEGALFLEDPSQRPLKNTSQFRTVRKWKEGK